MRLLWLACTVCRPFLTIFWFPFPLWLALPRDWALLDGGFCFFFNPPFFPLPSPIIPAAKLFASILLGLFGPAVYSSPNGPIRPLVFITSLEGSCVLFVFPWASRARLLSLGFLGPFLNFAFLWVFTEFFGVPRPNYIIPYPWDSWLCHQPLTFFVFIVLDLPQPILIFPYHILPMVCFFSLSGLL